MASYVPIITNGAASFRSGNQPRVLLHFGRNQSCLQSASALRKTFSMSSERFRGHLSGTLAIVAKKLHLRNTPALYRWLIGFTRLLRVRVFDYS
ncbi:hypothetical protein AGR1A_pAt20228 [Agrobacterium fabacearum CFBP 5771]|nr:hypothetical protein AGR1B_pAt30271 [Agrobacterium fabacearum S56]CVI24215.1 hypothetical protein AGR1A_pAt20228 [Agrobacterium fabacearum CFBP 5771]